MSVSPLQLLLVVASTILLSSLSATAAPQSKRRGMSSVRYVRIELPGSNRTLTLAEVQVLRDGRNIAPTGVASQSATEHGALAGRAIDGGTSGIFGEGSVSATPAGDQTWWELDLRNPQGVEQVTVWNRTDAGAEKLNKFTLKLLDRRRKVLFVRKNLSAPRPRTDYLMSGESVIPGKRIKDVAVGADRLHKLQPAINGAIETGVRYLKDTQLRDGSWGHHTPGYPSGQTALSVYTLVKCGVPRTDPSVRMGLRFLRENQPVKTYSIGILMMLYETLADKELRGQMQDLLDRLLETQKRSGDIKGLWGYPHGCDLSATQYAALGLYAAQRVGLKVPSEVYRDLLEGALRNQGDPIIVDVERKVGETSSGEIRMAGFSYRTGSGNYTGSMATAGLTIIAVCQRGLEANNVNKGMSAANAGLRMGFEWLHRNFSVDRSPKGGQHLYYLYGLERVGALLSKDYIGGKHWYWEGSEVLVRRQNKQGHWGNQSDSCFALLFLSKATASGALSGPTLKNREDVRLSEGPDVDIHWRVTGTNPVTMWITGFDKQLIEEYSDPGGIVKGMRITRVDYLCDGKVIKTILVDAKKGWQGARFATRYDFPDPGTFRMEVAIRLVDPLAQAGDNAETEMVSMPLDVFVRDKFTAAAIESKIGRNTPNLLSGTGVKGKMSSSLGKGAELARAMDRSQGTNWLSAKGDKQPTLTFSFNKPVRANTLVLSDANSSNKDTDVYDHPTRIEVNINNQRNPQYVDIKKGVLSKWTLKFKTTRVRSISIRVLERTPGKAKPGIMGFSEIELIYDR